MKYFFVFILCLIVILVGAAIGLTVKQVGVAYVLLAIVLSWYDTKRMKG